MNCIEFDQVMQASIVNRQPDERLARHAAECSRCAEAWRLEHALDQVIWQWKRQVPDVDLADAVLSNAVLPNTVLPNGAVGEPVLAGPRNRSTGCDRSPVTVRALASRAAFPGDYRPRSSSRPGGWGVLAVVAGALLLMLRTGASPVGSDPRDLVAHQSPQPELVAVPTSNPDAASPELSLLLEDTRSAYWNLAREAGDVASSVTVLWPPRDRQTSLESIEPSSGLLDHWKRNLQPIGRDVEKAFGFLLNAVPAEPSSRT